MNATSLQVSTDNTSVTITAVVPGTGTVKLTFTRRLLQDLLDHLNTATIKPGAATFPTLSPAVGAATHTIA